jgi:NIPSNAP
MPDQLRMYTIKPGEMAAWQEEWGQLIVPLRRRNGFEIVGAWIIKPDQFVWILRYTGSKTWEQADAAYYASPERTEMQPDPARHIARSEHSLMSPAGDGQADIVPSLSGGGRGAGSDGSITATEVITYAGALVTLAGLGTLLGTQYRQLGVIGRLAIPGLVAIAALLVARALPGQRARARRAQTSLVTLAVAAIALFTGQLQAEILGGPDAAIPPHTGYRILLVSALVAAVLAAVFLMRLRSGLLAAALSVSLLLAAISSILRLQLQHGWPVEAVFLVTGAILVAAAEYGRRLRVVWATEVLAFAGLSMAIITAFITAQDGNLPLEIFGGVLAAVGFAASVFRSSAGYAFAGGIGLFAFVLDIEFRYFQSSLGFAVSLVISGLALLGIALLLARLLPRFNLKR